MNKFFLVLILFLNTELISQNNPELFELKLNVSNIESSGNLIIAVWSNSDSWDNNMTNSSGQRIGFDYGFKEKVKKANKKEYYALLAVLWWIPLGSVWCAIAIWLRSSNQIKSFLGLNKNLNE